ncbi:MAG: hypothetical protein ACJ72V_06570 [Nitrososphaeraceae archaeon]
MNPDASPALLTKTELDWLQHKIKVSKVYEYRLRSDIKKKLGTFRQLELPLLMKNGFISSNDDLSAYTQSLSANPQSLESSNKARIELLKPKQESLGRDLDPGPLPYQGNDIRWRRYRPRLQTPAKTIIVYLMIMIVINKEIILNE